MNTSIERLVSIKEVAEMLGVSKSTIWGWLREKRFPTPIKINKTVTTWRLSSILQFIDEQE